MGKGIDPKDMQILRHFREGEQPLGSWQLANILREQGQQWSVATIGRSLNKLEAAGYLTQDGSQRGRILTEEGARAMALDRHLADITAQTLRLGKYIEPEVLEDFQTILEVRRIVEGGAARLAAQHATPEEIAFMESLLNQEEERYKTTWINQLDVDFHKAIVRAAKNQILESLYMQVIGMGQQSSAFEFLRKKINAGFVSKHRAILAAIREKDPDRAQAAMVDHIDTLMEDLRVYYDTYMEDASI